MSFPEASLLRLVDQISRPGALSLTTWPVSDDMVVAADVVGSYDYLQKVNPRTVVNHPRIDPDECEEMELLAHAGELFIDTRTARFVATSHVSESVFRACAEDFYSATEGRFGSLTNYRSGDLPDWSLPLDGQGRTTRVAFAEKTPDERYRRLLVGLNASEEMTWVLESE